MHVGDDVAWWDCRRKVSSRAAETRHWRLSASPGEARGKKYVEVPSGCCWTSVQEGYVLGSLVAAETVSGATGK